MTLVFQYLEKPKEISRGTYLKVGAVYVKVNDR
jgi:hypothetical protein